MNICLWRLKYQNICLYFSFPSLSPILVSLLSWGTEWHCGAIASLLDHTEIFHTLFAEYVLWLLLYFKNRLMDAVTSDIEETSWKNVKNAAWKYCWHFWVNRARETGGNDLSNPSSLFSRMLCLIKSLHNIMTLHHY